MVYGQSNYIYVQCIVLSSDITQWVIWLYFGMQAQLDWQHECIATSVTLCFLVFCVPVYDQLYWFDAAQILVWMCYLDLWGVPSGDQEVMVVLTLLFGGSELSHWVGGAALLGVIMAGLTQRNRMPWIGLLWCSALMVKVSGGTLSIKIV